MEHEYELMTKSDIIYTPILSKFIKKYGIKKIFTNKRIIHDYRFYILFISMQDYNLYKIIGIEYPLFLLNFIKYIQNNEVKKFVSEVINIDNPNMYKNFSEYPILYSWKYVYNIEPSNISDYNEITDKIYIKNIINKDKNFKLYTYDYNKVVKFLLFVWYSKYDLGISVLYKDSDDDINIDEILDFIDKDYSIYHYVNQSKKDYPLFKSSQNTIDSFRNLPDELISLNIDPGYIWKTPEAINKLTPIKLSENIYDLFFSLLYNCLINGIVTNKIIAWTYLFGYGKIDPLLLNKLFAITMNIPVNLSGIISDLYINKNFKAIEAIKENENDENYIYLQGQQNLNLEDIFTGLSNDILNIIAEKDFEPHGYFIKFDIDIDKINFNKNFFNILLNVNPISVNMEDIKNKITNTYNESYTEYYIQIYNSVNYINSFNNNFEAIVDYKFTIMSDLNDSNIKYFNLPIIKKEILNTLYNKYYFVPSNDIDLSKQYQDFIIKKSDLTNIYNLLINKDIEKNILCLIPRNMYLNTLFNSY
ncbi:virion protein (Cop-E6R) [Mythimna separata entomopoxvirus 'L']|uniref:Virion protein (Cop-E6R) n=1 Tax=Mythimna separata entomopoxvirus 'L' TaxID=1293572 RepID=A0A916P7L4_9POXV|nr:virion protein (Cop-E6R) [Mythimna separata entomopoxvirus 'L']CCU56411.1 virion protein (Cop-E6R) [Mythimna separata entomopoxvirus 'L']